MARTRSALPDSVNGTLANGVLAPRDRVPGGGPPEDAVGILPLKSVVIYDGAFTLNKNSSTMTQTVGGFYQATGGAAWVTNIVGNGQPPFTATLRREHANWLVRRLLSALPGSSLGQSHVQHLSVTVNQNDSSFTTSATASSQNVPLTCSEAWAAIVAGTPVSSRTLMRDGLLDVWETKGLHLNPGNAGKCEHSGDLGHLRR